MALALWAIPLGAYEVDGVDVHGSLSQSYMKTHGHEWLIPGSLEGTFEYTEFSLNAYKQFEHWNLGAQVISRDFGREGDFELRLDWAHVEFNALDALSLRLGRVKLPFGLYAEFRDVDMARTEILLPQTFLPEDYRGAAVAYDGVGVAGDIPIGESHLLQYHLYWGTNNIKDDFFLNYLTQGIYESATAVPPALPGISQDQAVLDTKTLRGGQLIWSYDPWQWRLGYNYLHYIGHFALDFYDLKNFAGGVPNVVRDELGLELDIQWHILSTDLFLGDWFFRAETMMRLNDYTQGDLFMDRFGGPGGLTTNLANGNELWSWYFSVQRQLLDSTGVYARFGRFILVEEEPVVGGSTKLNEFSVGVRHDFSEHVLGKLQVFHYWGYPGTLDQATNNDSSWGMVLARMTVHF
jgi:hypothetical protein